MSCGYQERLYLWVKLQQLFLLRVCDTEEISKFDWFQVSIHVFVQIRSNFDFKNLGMVDAIKTDVDKLLLVWKMKKISKFCFFFQIKSSLSTPLSHALNDCCWFTFWGMI